MNALLYSQLVPWYSLVDPARDHGDEAQVFARIIRREVPDARTLLELGAGAGNNALHLREHFTCTLTDLSPAMLELSRAQNPNCEHALGDMRSVRLDRTFDAVMVHDAVCYMLTERDLRAMADTLFAHTRPGGVALVIPDCVRETLSDQTELLSEDEGTRSMRCAMWTWDPDPNDTTYQVEFAFLFRDGTTVTPVHDQHTEGVFPRATWLRVLESAGFHARNEQEHYDNGYVCDLFVCRRP